MTRVLKFALLAAAFLFSSANACADPTLPHLLSDHMVLERGAPIRIWGWADPQEKIMVSLGAESRTGLAGADGRWELFLPAMPAGGPFILTVEGRRTIEVKDVTIGEVWVASGQSNMTFALRGAASAAEAIRDADQPNIRLFTVPGKVALQPQKDTLPASWQVCTPDVAKDFSAVAYFFARRLEDSLHVPIGIILSAWPGSAGEEWTDADSLHQDPILRPILDRWNGSPGDVKLFAAEAAPVDLEFDDFELLPRPDTPGKPVVLSDFDQGLARVSLGGTWTYDWRGAPETSFAMVSPGHRGTANAVRVSGRMAELDSASLEARFKPGHAPADLSAYAGVRFWVRGKGKFQLQTLEPTITDADNYESILFEATEEWSPVTIWFKDLRQEGWGVVNPLTPSSLTAVVLVCMPEVGYPPRPPTGLYQGMIAPLEPYRIRGVIWYQGEGNGWRGYQYRWLLPALIRTWRTAWSEGDFPFLIAQLPNYGTSAELGDSLWAEVREAQLLAARTVPNTGLAVTIDVGDPNNLHPPRKQEVGERLALWALGTTYDEKVVYSAPLYRSMRVEGDRVRIQFDLFNSSLVAHGDTLRGFSIAAADKKFHWADARIDGDSVVVSCAEVLSPIAVRYDWANSPDGNLYNAQGLPAAPFRTDDWPDMTFNTR